MGGLNGVSWQLKSVVSSSGTLNSKSSKEFWGYVSAHAEGLMFSPYGADPWQGLNTRVSWHSFFDYMLLSKKSFDVVRPGALVELMAKQTVAKLAKAFFYDDNWHSFVACKKTFVLEDLVCIGGDQCRQIAWLFSVASRSLANQKRTFNVSQ